MPRRSRRCPPVANQSHGSKRRGCRDKSDCNPPQQKIDNTFIEVVEILRSAVPSHISLLDHVTELCRQRGKGGGRKRNIMSRGTHPGRSSIRIILHSLPLVLLWIAKILLEIISRSNLNSNASTLRMYYGEEAWRSARECVWNPAGSLFYIYTLWRCLPAISILPKRWQTHSLGKHCLVQENE